MTTTGLLIAAVEADQVTEGGLGNALYMWLVLLAAMALAPFVLTMVTSFVKLVVVGSIIRSALGTQQIPPTQVITGLALILSVHIMWPVGAQVYANFQRLRAEAQTPAQGRATPPDDQPAGADDAEANRQGQGLEEWMSTAWAAARPPLASFLERHSHPKNKAMFAELQARLHHRQTQEGSAPVTNANSASTRAAVEDADPGEDAGLGEDAGPGEALSTPLAMSETVREMTVLVPAFVLSELTEAFQIGFLIFVPFLIIDLVVSNLLLAMGMFMLSPVTVSLPLKLLLFVLIDGWRLIIQGVILGYA